MLFIIYLTLSLAGSGWLVYRSDVTGFPACAGLFLLYTVLLFLAFFVLQVFAFALFSLTINVNRLPASIHNPYRWMGFETVRLFMQILHIRIHLHGLEKLPDSEPYLLVSNHRSIFDPLVGLIWLKDYDLAYVSKQENFKIPFVGRYIAAIGCVPLDRENAKAAILSIKKAADNIKRGYVNYGIYPEGWENKSHDPLLPFRSGAFKIAKDAGCQVVISAIRNSDHIFRRAFTFRPIHIHLDVLDTIPAEVVKAEKTGELSDRAFRIMEDFLTEHPADDWKLGRKG
ncbi:MAG: 1-acyl-sn-glycerol-3-phosphate acyltransferase [Eubacterium sp.]|nr:1-acyl-sn-glycerol-3-phosphate acyltransferase [Eubacterium sp.]